jgi:hypothetical protein
VYIAELRVEDALAVWGEQGEEGGGGERQHTLRALPGQSEL